MARVLAVAARSITRLVAKVSVARRVEVPPVGFSLMELAALPSCASLATETTPRWISIVPVKSLVASPRRKVPFPVLVRPVPPLIFPLRTRPSTAVETLPFTTLKLFPEANVIGVRRSNP